LVELKDSPDLGGNMDATLREIRTLVNELKTDLGELDEVRIHDNIVKLDSLLLQSDEKQKDDAPSIDAICATLTPCLKAFRQMFEKRLDNKGLIEFLLEGAKTNVSLGKFNEALAIYGEIIILSDASNNSTVAKCEAIKNIGHIYSRQGKWDRADEYYKQVIDLYEQHNNLPQVANIYNNLGYNAAMQGNFSQAEEYHQRAIQIGQECNVMWLIADAHNSLGIIASVQSKWDEAMENFENAIAIYDGVDDLQPDDRRCIAQTYHNSAMAYVDCEEWEEAGRFYQEATGIAEELGDLPLMASIYINRAEFFLNLASMAMAKTYCQKAWEIFGTLEDKLGLAEAHKLYGRIYRREQDWSAAEAYFNESISISKGCSNLLGLAEGYYEFGLMLKDRDELNQAQAYLNKSLQLFSQLKADDEIQQVKKVLGTLTN
jgi:tetratricopeptide (TPR) repeat protein